MDAVDYDKIHRLASLEIQQQHRFFFYGRHYKKEIVVEHSKKEREGKKTWRRDL